MSQKHRIHFLVTVDVEPNENTRLSMTDKEMGAEIEGRLDDYFRHSVNMHTKNVIGSYCGLSLHAIEDAPSTE